MLAVQSCLTLGLHVARQAPLSMGFSRQEYWPELLCPPPGDLPDPWIKPGSPTLQVDSLRTEQPGKPCVSLSGWQETRTNQIVCVNNTRVFIRTYLLRIPHTFPWALMGFFFFKSRFKNEGTVWEQVGLFVSHKSPHSSHYCKVSFKLFI